MPLRMVRMTSGADNWIITSLITLSLQTEFAECWHYSIYIAAIYLVLAYSLEKIIKVSVLK